MFQVDNFISFHDLTPEACFLWASSSITTCLGYDPDEVVGMKAYDVIHKDDIEYVKLTHQESVLNEMVGTQLLLRIKAKDESYVPCMVIFSLCYDYIVSCYTVVDQSAGTSKCSLPPLSLTHLQTLSSIVLCNLPVHDVGGMYYGMQDDSTRFSHKGTSAIRSSEGGTNQLRDVQGLHGKTGRNEMTMLIPLFCFDCYYSAEGQRTFSSNDQPRGIKGIGMLQCSSLSQELSHTWQVVWGSLSHFSRVGVRCGEEVERGGGREEGVLRLD